MNIKTKNLTYEEISEVIRTIPEVRSAINSNGYEIKRKSGRIHIIFTGEGLDVHRDTGGKHKVTSPTDSTRKIHKLLKERIERRNKYRHFYRISKFIKNIFILKVNHF